MKFKDHQTGREYNLTKIIGSDFWADGDGDAYVTDEYLGICYSIRAVDALEALLRRENIRKDIGCFCQRKDCRMASVEADLHDILKRRKNNA